MQRDKELRSRPAVGSELRNVSAHQVIDGATATSRNCDCTMRGRWMGCIHCFCYSEILVFGGSG